MGKLFCKDCEFTLIDLINEKIKIRKEALKQTSSFHITEKTKTEIDLLIELLKEAKKK